VKEILMPEDKHSKALDLTDAALEKIVAGDEKAADQLIEQARKLDPSAPERVLRDVDEDASNTRSKQVGEFQTDVSSAPVMELHVTV
jgi:hypothetical protein